MKVSVCFVVPGFLTEAIEKEIVVSAEIDAESVMTALILVEDSYEHEIEVNPDITEHEGLDGKVTVLGASKII